MSMILCPDCGHEVSTAATACPNCGHPFAKPVIERKVVVADVPRKEGIPSWVFAVLGILGVLVLFILFAVMRNNDDEANRSVNVSLAANRNADNTLDTAAASRASTDTQTLTVPPSTGSQSITVPSASAPSTYRAFKRHDCAAAFFVVNDYDSTGNADYGNRRDRCESSDQNRRAASGSQRKVLSAR
jgi:hypothetical protein